MDQQELIPHLFRTEFSKITSVLTRLFGLEHMAVAEDIASETFLSAMETWTYKGIPANPTAWLYTVAKNKARNYILRNRTFSGKIAQQIKSSSSETEEVEIDLSDHNIKDSQLQMLFALCHPSIPVEAQIGLSLRVLCGFGIDEIATAFLTSKETINKRLYRAREKLREEKVKISLPSGIEIAERLETVLKTLYLLFNEGYYSETNDAVLREDLCLEAMRLTYLLVENENTSRPSVYALLSLMCFHASRFPARKTKSGEIVLYEDQDESLWNRELISKGTWFLHQASYGKDLTKYHLEASIAFWNTQKPDTEEKWKNILQLYDWLLQLEYSPVAELNRLYALSRVKGRKAALAEAENLQLPGNHYHFTLLGELYSGIDDELAKRNFEKAYGLAKTSADREAIRKRMNELKCGET